MLFGLQPRSMKNLPPIKNITDAPEVEKHYLKRTPFGPIYPSLKFADDEDAVVLTTDLLRYCISQHVMKDWQCHTVSHLLTIPHFKGGAFCLKHVYAPVVLVNAGDCDFQMLPSGLIEREIL